LPHSSVPNCRRAASQALVVSAQLPAMQAATLKLRPLAGQLQQCVEQAW